MRKSVIALLLAGICCGTAALADPDGSQVTVQSDEADIRAGKGPIYEVIRQALQGQVLNVDSNEDDWLKVHATIDNATISGYVYKVSLTDAKPDTSSLTGTGGFATVSDTEAGKGLEPDTTAYAGAKNLSPDRLLDLIKFRHDKTKLSVEDFEAFTKDGNVGMKPRAAAN